MITKAAFSPAMLNAFVAPVTVTPCSRAASDTVRNGVYGVSGCDSGPCTSSETMVTS